MNTINWVQVTVDILQSVIGGVFVGLVIYWLDERRAKRERRLSDYRIACNWHTTEPKVSLRNFDLTKANLSGHKFIKANLEGAVLTGAALWGADFSEAKLREADFRKARLVGTKFTKASAAIADFSWSTITNRSDPDHEYTPDFTGAKLAGSKFVGARLNGVALKGTKLQGTDFSRAIVLNCDFTDADLTRSNWKWVKRVVNCIWKNVKVDKPENFPSALWDEIRRQNMK